MFKESPEGSTHHFGDNCGEPAHNSSLNQLLDKTGEEFLDKLFQIGSKYLKRQQSSNDHYPHFWCEVKVSEEVKKIVRQSQIEAVKAFAEEIKKEIPGELSVLIKSIDKKLEELC
jgi:hypothetical protein